VGTLYVATVLGLIAACGVFAAVWSLAPAAPTNADIVEGRLRIYEAGKAASLSEMERRLRSAGFVRIHRSRLVRREAVAAVESKPTGDFIVRLRDGRELAGSRRYRRPLLAAELARFETVVLDPPRPGAKAQVEALAQSGVARVLYVSCNPASFARDARILVDGGFELGRIVPLDQFLWSPHVELFALFARSR